MQWATNLYLTDCWPKSLVKQHFRLVVKWSQHGTHSLHRARAHTLASGVPPSPKKRHSRRGTTPFAGPTALGKMRMSEDSHRAMLGSLYLPFCLCHRCFTLKLASTCPRSRSDRRVGSKIIALAVDRVSPCVRGGCHRFAGKPFHVGFPSKKFATQLGAAHSHSLFHVVKMHVGQKD